MKDYRGTEINVGSYVAFNKSGAVKFGKVVGFGKKDMWRYRYSDERPAKEVVHDILIEADDSPGKVSCVRWSESVAVVCFGNC